MTRLAVTRAFMVTDLAAGVETGQITLQNVATGRTLDVHVSMRAVLEILELAATESAPVREEPVGQGRPVAPRVVPKVAPLEVPSGHGELNGGVWVASDEFDSSGLLNALEEGRIMGV